MILVGPLGRIVFLSCAVFAFFFALGEVLADRLIGPVASDTSALARPLRVEAV
jgi:hypothetical protein